METVLKLKKKKKTHLSFKDLSKEQVIAALDLIGGDGHTVWKASAFEKIWPEWAVNEVSKEIESDTSDPRSTIFGHSGEVIAKLIGVYGLDVLYRHSGDGLAARSERYSSVYRATRDHRAAIRSYCAGNKHLEDNARGCGNM